MQMKARLCERSVGGGVANSIDSRAVSVDLKRHLCRCRNPQVNDSNRAKIDSPQMAPLEEFANQCFVLARSFTSAHLDYLGEHE
jgi:hypothetical protein